MHFPASILQLNDSPCSPPKRLFQTIFLIMIFSNQKDGNIHYFGGNCEICSKKCF